MTNFEKIKNMRVRQFAYKISIAISDCELCPIYEFCITNRDDSHKFHTCSKMWEQWLKSEVEE